MSATLTDRDKQIAALIREEIAKDEVVVVQLGCERGSPPDAFIRGRILGLRKALAFVEPKTS